MKKTKNKKTNPNTESYMTITRVMRASSVIPQVYFTGDSHDRYSDVTRTHSCSEHHIVQYLYVSFNPVDQLGYSAVDAWLIAPSAALSPAHHPCQPPLPTGCLTHQGSTAVPLHTGTNRLGDIAEQDFFKLY